MSPRIPIYDEGTNGARYVRIAGWVSALAMVVTFLVVIVAWNEGPSWALAMYVSVAFWGTVPAVWFWYEYFFLYRRFGAEDTFDLFRHGQQTAIAIWAGVTLSLVAIASSDHFKTSQAHSAGSISRFAN